MQVSKRSRYLKLALLLIVYTAGVLVHQSILPTLEGNDEVLHYNYAVWMRETGQLPDRTEHDTNPMRQESGQPPLTYAVDAVVFKLLNIPDQAASSETMDPVRNAWFTPPDWSRRSDNFNLFVHGPDERAFGHPAIVEADAVGRFISLFYTLLAVVGGYGIARECFRQEAWVWTATALFAFSPEMVYLGSMMSNDAPTTAFATLAIWQCLVVLRRGGSSRRVLVIGILTALAAFSKVSGLLVAPGAVIAIYFDARNRHVPLKRMLINVALFMIPIAVLIGPWVVWGTVTYGDPLGLRSHNDAIYRTVNLPPVLEVIRTMPETYMSYWAKFGASSSWLSPLAYLLLTLIVVLSLWGYIGYLRHHRFQWRSLRGQQIIVAAISGLLALAALGYWQLSLYRYTYAIIGRLIYFAHGAYIMGLIGGLYLLAQRMNHRQVVRLRTYAIGVTTGAALILGPVASYATYQSPQFLTRDQLPALRGGPIDFNKTIRFLGYDASDSPFIQENTLHHDRLCWEVLKPATQLSVFSVKIFGPKAEGIGGRTSIFGMGQFPTSAWETGEIFCDQVDVPITGTLQPGQIYNVILIVSNAPDTDNTWQATAPDGTVIASPLIYEAASAAGDMTAIPTSQKIDYQPTTIHFPQLADLKGLAITGTPNPGSSISFDFLWNVLGNQHNDWREFLHLEGGSTAISLGDGPPRNGQYPTWAWTNGEKITENWQTQIPANLAPGDYRIVVGFYDPVSGQRLTASQDGNVLPDGSAVLLKFSVK